MKKRVGGGAAIHGRQRWRKCLHSTFRYSTNGREKPVWFSYFNCAGREHSDEYFYSFHFLCKGFMVRVWLQHMYACLCTFMQGVQWDVGYIHMHTSVYCAFVHICLHKSVHARHTFQSMNLCLCFTRKSCILIRSQRPFRESNPPGCDFPPLVLRGWGDWDCLGQLSLLR